MVLSPHSLFVFMYIYLRLSFAVLNNAERYTSVFISPRESMEKGKRFKVSSHVSGLLVYLCGKYRTIFLIYVK